MSINSEFLTNTYDQANYIFTKIIIKIPKIERKILKIPKIKWKILNIPKIEWKILKIQKIKGKNTKNIKGKIQKIKGKIQKIKGKITKIERKILKIPKIEWKFFNISINLSACKISYFQFFFSQNFVPRSFSKTALPKIKILTNYF